MRISDWSSDVCSSDLTKLARDPRPELANRLGSEEAAERFLDLIGGMGSVWPEPVYVNTPCCPKLSYDEMMVLDLWTAAARTDRKAFDDFLRDTLPHAAGDQLYAPARREAGQGGE